MEQQLQRALAEADEARDFLDRQDHIRAERAASAQQTLGMGQAMVADTDTDEYVTADAVNRRLDRLPHLNMRDVQRRYVLPDGEMEWHGRKIVTPASAQRLNKIIDAEHVPSTDDELEAAHRPLEEWDNRTTFTWENYRLELRAECGAALWDNGPGIEFTPGTTVLAFSVWSPYTGFKQKRAPRLNAAPVRGDARPAFTFTKKYIFRDGEALVKREADGQLTDLLSNRTFHVTDDDLLEYDDEEGGAPPLDPVWLDAELTAPLIYRPTVLPVLGGRQLHQITLELPTAFLRQEFGQWGNGGQLVPFAPDPTRWCMMMNSGLPQSERDCPFEADLFHFLLRGVAFVWPLQRFIDEVEDARRVPQGQLEGYRPAQYHHFLIEQFNLLYPEATHIESSFNLVLMLEHVAPGANLAVPALDPMAAALGDELVPRLLASEFMAVRSNPAATSIRDWIIQPDLSLPTLTGTPRCVYEMIISTYSAPIHRLYESGQLLQAQRMLPRIDLPSLQHYFRMAGWSDANAQGNDVLRVRVEGLRAFCALFGISLDVYNARTVRVPALCCRCTSAQKKGITPSHLYVCVRDGHIYKLDQGLEHTPLKEALEPVHQAAPSATLHIPDLKEKRQVFFIEALEDLLTLDLSVVPVGETADIRVNESLEALLIMMQKHWSLSTDMLTWSSFGSQLIKVSFWLDGRLLSFSAPIAPGSLQLGVEQQCSAEYLTHHDQLFDNVYHSVAKQPNLSSFNERAMSFLEVDNRSALCGRFVPDDGSITTESDRTLDYAACMLKIEKWAVFSEEDEPQLYDGHALEPYTLYHVARTASLEQLSPAQLTLLNKPVIVTIGGEYQRAAHLYSGVSRITHFLRPSFLRINKSAKAIKAALGDLVLTRQHRKGIPVRNIGRFGKKLNTRRETRVFVSANEANYFAAEFGGRVWTHHYNFRPSDGINATSDHLFVWEGKQLTTRYTTSLRIVQLQVFDSSRTTLALAIEAKTAAGFIVVATKTDAFYFVGHELVTVNKEDCLGTIGQRTCEPKAAPPKLLTLGNVPQPKVLLRAPLPIINHTLINEYSCKEAVQLVKEHDVLILGGAPGAGKSRLAETTLGMLSSRYGPTLFVAPTNELVMQMRATGGTASTAGELRKRGLLAVTYDQLLGTRVSDEGHTVDTEGSFCYTVGGRKMGLADFRSFSFDEAFFLDSPKRARLRAFVARARAAGQRMLATGDVRQLPPIENGQNQHVNAHQQMTDFGRSLFPHAIVLEIPKRIPKEQIPRLLAIRDTLFNLELSPTEARRQVLETFRHIGPEDIPVGARVLTYKNTTRVQLNHMQHYRTHETEFSVGLRLIYNNSTRKQGTRKLIKNFTYEITAITEEKIRLAELGDASVTFELSVGCVREWFQYVHAKTGHSSQGSTIDAVVVVADSRHFFASLEWLWVVLTRGRDLDQVLILRTGELPVDVARLRSRIAGHEAADRAAGREGCDVTVEWVLETHKAQKGLCGQCHVAIDLPRVGVNERMASLSIDRMDSLRAHEQENCWLTCRSCNCSRRNAPV